MQSWQMSHQVRPPLLLGSLPTAAAVGRLCLSSLSSHTIIVLSLLPPVSHNLPLPFPDPPSSSSSCTPPSPPLPFLSLFLLTDQERLKEVYANLIVDVRDTVSGLEGVRVSGVGMVVSGLGRQVSGLRPRGGAGEWSLGHGVGMNGPGVSISSEWSRRG